MTAARCFRRWLPVWVGVCAWLPIWGQEVAVRVRFGADSVAVGQPLVLSIEVTHPTGTQVVAPDEARHFGTWTVLAKQPAETETSDGALLTRLVYSITTFEVKRIQSLGLAPCVLRGADTLCAAPDTAHIFLAARVHNTAPDVPYRAHTDLYPVVFPINWTLVGLALGLGLAVLALVLVLLRKPYFRWRARRRLAGEYTSLQRQLAHLQSQNLAADAYVASVNALWRKYIGNAWGVPLHALSTRELARVLVAARADAHTAGLPPTDALLHLAKLEDDMHYAQRRHSANEVLAHLPALQPVLNHAYTLNLSRIQ